MKIYDCFTYYDEDLKIKWKIKNSMISKEDKSLLSFKKKFIKMYDNITVVIVTFNPSLNILNRCLRSIDNQIKILIIDNSSNLKLSQIENYQTLFEGNLVEFIENCFETCECKSQFLPKTPKISFLFI